MSALFQRLRRRRPRVDYEEAKRRARDADPEVRRALAADADMRPEILYFLAEDAAPVVRRTVAANASTPRHADRILARDDDDEVRCELARKIGRLIPDLDDADTDHIRSLTFEVLDILAHDQLPMVRQIVAEEIKDCDRVPRHIVYDLARDVELVVAAPVLEYSMLLTDEDLLEIIESGPIKGALAAISRRRRLSAPVADGIAASGDADAVATLLANKSAQIREETLDALIDDAPAHEPWHEPLVERPELSVRAVRRIARFVGLKLLNMLESRHDLPAEAVSEVRRAVAARIERAGVGGDLDAGVAAEEAFVADTVDDAAVLAAIERGNHDFVVKALALEAKVPEAAVRKAIANQAAKAVTALAWAAGLAMRTAIQIQLRVAKVAPAAVLNARDGFDYPLSEDDLRWQLELLRD